MSKKAGEFSNETKELMGLAVGHCWLCRGGIHSHHHRVHNDKYNRARYPLFLVSPMNDVPACYGHHKNKQHLFDFPNEKVVKVYEDYLQKLKDGTIGYIGSELSPETKDAMTKALSGYCWLCLSPFYQCYYRLCNSPSSLERFPLFIVSPMNCAPLCLEDYMNKRHLVAFPNLRVVRVYEEYLQRLRNNK